MIIDEEVSLKIAIFRLIGMTEKSFVKLSKE